MRAFHKTDAGFASPGETRTPFESHTRPASAAGVVASAPRRTWKAALAPSTTIRSNAPGASAAACGSDSRGVPLQLGFTPMYRNTVN